MSKEKEEYNGSDFVETDMGRTVSVYNIDSDGEVCVYITDHINDEEVRVWIDKEEVSELIYYLNKSVKGLLGK